MLSMHAHRGSYSILYIHVYACACPLSLSASQCIIILQVEGFTLASQDFQLTNLPTCKMFFFPKNWHVFSRSFSKLGPSSILYFCACSVCYICMCISRPCQQTMPTAGHMFRYMCTTGTNNLYMVQLQCQLPRGRALPHAWQMQRRQTLSDLKIYMCILSPAYLVRWKQLMVSIWSYS